MMRLLKPTLIMLVLLAGTIVRADTFVFNKEGLAIDTPVGWHVLSVSESAGLLDKTNVTEDFKQAARSASGALLISLLRENPPVGATPGIHLHYRSGSIVDFDTAFGVIAQNLTESLPKTEILDPYRRDDLGPFEAYVLRYQYELISNGVPFPLVEKLWLVPLGEHYLTIGAGTGRDEVQAVWDLIDNAAHSLRPFP